MTVQFSHHTLLLNSDGITPRPNGGLNYRRDMKLSRFSANKFAVSRKERDVNTFILYGRLSENSMSSIEPRDHR